MQHLTLEVHSFFAASFMPVVAMTASSVHLDEIFSLVSVNEIVAGRGGLVDFDVGLRSPCYIEPRALSYPAIPLAFIPSTGDYGPDSRMTRDRGSGWLAD